MRGLLEGETIHSTSTISFTSRQPGATTFVDCALDVREATLNGRPLDLGTVERRSPAACRTWPRTTSSS